MKGLFLIFIFFCFIYLISEAEVPEVEKRNIDFIVSFKTTQGDRYYIQGNDTILNVHPDDYMRYNIGDTIKFQTDKTGFFRGTWFLRK